MTEPESTAQALFMCLMSAAVRDHDGEPANVVDCLDRCARGLQHIADAIDRLACALGGREARHECRHPRI